MLLKLKQLLGITEDSKNFVLQYVIDTVTDMILSYCNIKILPDQLENIVLMMCMDMYRAESFGQETTQGSVKSMTEGDVSISFGSAYSTTDNPAMCFLKGYTAQLDRYRCLGRW